MQLHYCVTLSQHIHTHTLAKKKCNRRKERKKRLTNSFSFSSRRELHHFVYRTLDWKKISTYRILLRKTSLDRFYLKILKNFY